MDLFTAIDSRASAVKLRAPAPSKEHIERIIDAGSRAPDHGKLTPWRFAVLGEQTRNQIGDIMARAFLAKEADADEDAVKRERAKVTSAPCIIAAVASVAKPNKIPEVEQIVAVGAAVQNMFLAAHALGYGVMWKTGPAYNAEVKAVLGLKPDDHIIGLLYLGSADMPGTPRGSVIKEPVRWLP